MKKKVKYIYYTYLYNIFFGFFVPMITNKVFINIYK